VKEPYANTGKALGVPEGAGDPNVHVPVTVIRYLAGDHRRPVVSGPDPHAEDNELGGDVRRSGRQGAGVRTTPTDPRA
jgi:hypothetical protein